MDTDIGLHNLDVVMGLENRIVYDLVDVVEGTAACARRDQGQALRGLYLMPAATRDKNA